jgi:cation transport ATPase
VFETLTRGQNRNRRTGTLCEVLAIEDAVARQHNEGGLIRLTHRTNANQKGQPVGRKDPEGVRGPGGPPPPQPRMRRTSNDPSAAREALERRSFRYLLILQRVPRWLVVIAMALALFFGLIQSGSLAWLGGILLLVVALFLGWLLALAWPILSPAARGIRLIVVAATVGLALLKFADRF